MNKELLKLLKITLIVFVIIGLILSVIVSQDEYHISTCHEEHCVYCLIIHLAQNILSLASVFIVAVVIGFLIYFFLSRLHKEYKAFVQSSLVFQKIQFNE